VSFIVQSSVIHSGKSLHAVISWHAVSFIVQPTTDRVAQNLEIISKNFQFSTRRTRILMGFNLYYTVIIVNPMGRILVRWKSCRNNLEIQCHPICNWLCINTYAPNKLITCIVIHSINTYPPNKLLRGGFWTPFQTNVLSRFVPQSLSRGRYALVSSGRVRHPLDSKKHFVRLYTHSHKYTAFQSMYSTANQGAQCRGWLAVSCRSEKIHS